MKSFIINTIGGLITILIIWLITMNNYFVFGYLTLYIPYFLYIIYHFLSTKFNWIISIINFLICLIVIEMLMNYLIKTNGFPSEYLDEDQFPTGLFLFTYSIYWVILKLILDLLLINIMNRKFIKVSRLEKIWEAIIERKKLN